MASKLHFRGSFYSDDQGDALCHRHRDPVLSCPWLPVELDSAEPTLPAAQSLRLDLGGGGWGEKVEGDAGEPRT